MTAPKPHSIILYRGISSVIASIPLPECRLDDDPVFLALHLIQPDYFRLEKTDPRRAAADHQVLSIVREAGRIGHGLRLFLPLRTEEELQKLLSAYLSNHPHEKKAPVDLTIYHLTGTPKTAEDRWELSTWQPLPGEKLT